MILYYKDENAKKLRNRIPIWSIVKIEKMIADVHQLPAKLKPLYQYGFRIQTADSNGFELLAEVCDVKEAQRVCVCLCVCLCMRVCICACL